MQPLMHAVSSDPLVIYPVPTLPVTNRIPCESFALVLGFCGIRVAFKCRAVCRSLRSLVDNQCRVIVDSAVRNARAHEQSKQILVEVVAAFGWDLVCVDIAIRKFGTHMPAVDYLSVQDDPLVLRECHEMYWGIGEGVVSTILQAWANHGAVSADLCANCCRLLRDLIRSEKCRSIFWKGGGFVLLLEGMEKHRDSEHVNVCARRSHLVSMLDACV